MLQSDWGVSQFYSVNVVDGGLLSIGAPSEKRFGLRMLSAMAANLAYTSDALHASLVGSWISVLYIGDN